MHNDKYLAFVLDAMSRERLLRMYTPVYPNVKAHHVTLQYDVTRQGLDLFEDRTLTVRVTGYARNERVECLTASVNGLPLRLDRSRYHITLSCADGAEASESNKLLMEHPERIESAYQMLVMGQVELVPR